MRKLTTRRTDLMDTSDWAHREMLRRYRHLAPGESLQMMLDLLDHMCPETRNREEAALLKRFRALA